jgi:4-amino-4-deoxy-L-arabinose transferase-like glycosyltransferase
MPFAVGLSGALFSLYDYREAPRRGFPRALAFWLFLAVATLSKGPAAIVLCGLVIAGDAALRAFAGDPAGSLAHSRRALFSPPLLLSALLFLALVLPWFALVQHRYPGYLSFYLWKEHLHRAAGSEHAEPFYWFVPWVLGGLLPWTPLAFAAVPAWRSSLTARSTETRVVRFLLLWAATVFLVFSLARGKLATYILPMFPPLAILVGCFIDRVRSANLQRRSVGIAFGAASFVLLGTVVAAIVGLTIVPSGLGVAARGLLVTPVLAAGIATYLRREGAVWKPLVALVFGAVALYLAVAAVAPALCRSFTARPLIELVGRQLGPEDTYTFWGKYLPSAAFYLERPPLLVGTRPELRFGSSLMGGAPGIVGDLRELDRRTKGGKLYVFTDNRAKRERELRAALGDVRLVAKNYVAAVWLRL